MIDHISVAVRDLDASASFYATLLAPLGLAKLREWPNAAVGFGKKYPEFWINRRDAMHRVADDSGVHVCLRARDTAAVDAFHAAALTGRRHVGRRTGDAAGILCALLRRLHPRPGWQSYRSGDVPARGGRIEIIPAPE